REAIWPFLKIINVGIDWMPYLAAVCGFSSTLSLTILTLPPSVPAISSSAGAIIRQGPHHSAQKSTTTGPVAFNTSDSKVASETLPTAMGDPLVARRRRASSGEPKLWTRCCSVKTASRGGDARQCLVEGLGRYFHQIRDIGPDQRGAHGFAGIQLRQHRAVERKLADVGLGHLVQPPRRWA